MLKGLDHVWKAVDLLVVTDESLQARLQKAAPEFFVSMMQEDEWPQDLIAKAKNLSARLQQIKSMTLAQMQQAAIDLVDLSTHVDAAHREEIRHQG